MIYDSHLYRIECMIRSMFQFFFCFGGASVACRLFEILRAPRIEFEKKNLSRVSQSNHIPSHLLEDLSESTR